ncbi:MAG: Signal transduction histidine kinase [Friedmanniella sp.]|nr:Signal transduction histidine kinase [Friedmanniella sp.]
MVDQGRHTSAGGVHDDAAERLERLLEANRSIVAALTLDEVLSRVVAAARETTGADYAALGVLGPDGGLEQFVHLGMDPGTVAAIGDLPKGKGLLGALIQDPRPIRLPVLGQDPRSSGFPEGHPPMSAFLGVPVRVREETFGNLYLANGPDGGVFSEQDERLAAALAANAGTAIANARLYEQSRYRQTWLEASAEITRRLAVARGGGVEVLEVIARAVLRLTSADVVTVVLPDPDDAELLRVVVAVGLAQAELTGLRYLAKGSLGQQVMQERRGRIRDDVDVSQGLPVHLRQFVNVTQVMALPLQGETSCHGAIVAGRVPRRPFVAFDLDMAAGFASQTALALELLDARSSRERLAVLEDRDRIARDLHEHVVQRLFAAGMRLEGSLTRVQDPELRKRLWQTIEDLDGTIRQVRTSIFALHGSGPVASSLRGRILRMVEELTPVLGFKPGLVLDGPVDTMAGPAAADVEAVVRESLSNVAKHAGASEVSVEVRASEEALTVVVADNGRGLDTTTRRSGLANLRQRAERLGGSMTLEPVEGGGLRLLWTVPSGL